MTTHTPAIEVSHDQAPLPNQHFSPWLRSQTTLFISQISAILGFIAFIATLIYYVSGVSKTHGALLEPLMVRLVVDYAHIVFIALFILAIIRVLDDNEHGSYRVRLVYRRVFGEHKGNFESELDDSSEQLRKFKRRFLWFWIGMLFLYVCFACQHSYELATKKSVAGVDTSVLQQLAFPFTVFFFNNLTLLFIFWCFLILYIPSGEMGDRYYKYRNGSFLVVGLLTALFPLLALIKVNQFTAAEWKDYASIFEALSGVLNAIALALLIARLDSKLVGLPSWLISTLYSYAAVQPLFMVFGLSPADVLQQTETSVLKQIETSVLIFVFVSKIYFFLIITYAMQTGKMLNYLFCFPILRGRAENSGNRKHPAGRRGRRN